MSTLKILLADADEDSRIALEQDLEQERSLEVIGSTGDGMDAIKLIEKTDLDIIIMDLVLAGVDGLEVLEQMSQMERKRPMVIVYSAYIRGSVTLQAAEYGADYFIMKPCSSQLVAERIRQQNLQCTHSVHSPFPQTPAVLRQRCVPPSVQQ